MATKKNGRYDMVAAPLTLFDWKTPGKLLRDDVVGHGVESVHKQLKDMIDADWRIAQMAIVNHTVYFLMERQD